MKNHGMKFVQTLFAAVVVALAFSACGEKKQEKDIIAKKPVVKAPASPVRMQDSSFSDAVDWLGKQYSFSIVRTADTGLPVVVDDAGGKYYDNKIAVNVKRPDGTVFFDKTFTKDDFSSQVSGDYLKKSALLGVVFDHVDGDNLVFAASVGAPDALSDDYVPLLLTVSRMGAVSISKDMRLDGEMEE